MTDRYEGLSDRARWFLNNFDEIDLADICASQEASNQTRQEALARVHHVADLIAAGAPWTANRDNLAQRIREAATIDAGQTATQATESATCPAHDAGPTVRECAANDRHWDTEKTGEQRA